MRRISSRTLVSYCVDDELMKKPPMTSRVMMLSVDKVFVAGESQ